MTEPDNKKRALEDGAPTTAPSTTELHTFFTVDEGTGVEHYWVDFALAPSAALLLSAVREARRRPSEPAEKAEFEVMSLATQMIGMRGNVTHDDDDLAVLEANPELRRWLEASAPHWEHWHMSRDSLPEDVPYHVHQFVSWL